MLSSLLKNGTGSRKESENTALCSHHACLSRFFNGLLDGRPRFDGSQHKCFRRTKNVRMCFPDPLRNVFHITFDRMIGKVIDLKQRDSSQETSQAVQSSLPALHITNVPVAVQVHFLTTVAIAHPWWWNAGDDIVVVHINDAIAGRAPDEQIDNERALPGETGVMDITGFLQALRDIYYEGPITTEPFSQRVRDMEDEAAVRATSAAMDTVWQQAGLL